MHAKGTLLVFQFPEVERMKKLVKDHGDIGKTGQIDNIHKVKCSW